MPADNQHPAIVALHEGNIRRNFEENCHWVLTDREKDLVAHLARAVAQELARSNEQLLATVNDMTKYGTA